MYTLAHNRRTDNIGTGSNTLLLLHYLTRLAFGPSATRFPTRLIATTFCSSTYAAQLPITPLMEVETKYQMYACMHACMYVMCACMHACMYACMYVCMYVLAYVVNEKGLKTIKDFQVIYDVLAYVVDEKGLKTIKDFHVIYDVLAYVVNEKGLKTVKLLVTRDS